MDDTARSPVGPGAIGGEPRGAAVPGGFDLPLRHAPGGVVLVMSPQLALCELSSHESSSGGFRQAELTSCELSSHRASLARRAPVREGYSGVVRVGRVGLVVSAGAGSCPNLPQRRPGSGSAARRSAEYQRFFSCAPARSGPLWQIWTTGAVAGPVGRAVVRLGEVHGVGAGAGTGEAGGRGPGGRPVRPRRPRESTAAGPYRCPGPWSRDCGSRRPRPPSHRF